MRMIIMIRVITATVMIIVVISRTGIVRYRILKYLS